MSCEAESRAIEIVSLLWDLSAAGKLKKKRNAQMHAPRHPQRQTLLERRQGRHRVLSTRVTEKGVYLQHSRLVHLTA